MYEKFLNFIKFKFLWKNCSENIKSFLTQHPQALQQLMSRHFLNIIQKPFSPIPIYKKGQRLCILYERLQRRVITILYDRFFIYRTVKS